MSCSLTSKKLCCRNDCDICFNRSFASSNKAIFWSQNNNATPRQVFKNTHSKYNFTCNVCKHDFKASLGHVNNGKWCPYCCISSPKLCNDNDCFKCYNNSLASIKQYKNFSNKNKINPRSIAKFSNKKFIFWCEKCEHEFKSAVSDITNGQFCPFCNHKHCLPL